MKKVCLSLIILIATTASVFGAMQSQISSDRIGDFTLHTYQSNDPLGDTSFIVESDNALVLIEPQAFTANVTELLGYIKELGKPLKEILVAFHPAGLRGYPTGETVITKSMDGFVKSEAGKGMLGHFGKAFQGQMDVEIVKFDSIVAANTVLEIDGVKYTLSPTSLPGMPGVNIDIDGRVFYQHFAPVAETHPSPFYIGSKQAISAAILDAEKAQKGSYSLFIGAHYPGKGTVDDLAFEVDYLKTMKAVVGKIGKKEEFITEMKKAYPGIAEEKNLVAIAGKIFK